MFIVPFFLHTEIYRPKPIHSFVTEKHFIGLYRYILEINSHIPWTFITGYAIKEERKKKDTLLWYNTLYIGWSQL